MMVSTAIAVLPMARSPMISSRWPRPSANMRIDHQHAGLHRLGDELAVDDRGRRTLHRRRSVRRRSARRRPAAGPADRRCGRADPVRPARGPLRRCRARVCRLRRPRCRRAVRSRWNRVQRERKADLAAARSAPVRSAARPPGRTPLRCRRPTASTRPICSATGASSAASGRAPWHPVSQASRSAECCHALNSCGFARDPRANCCG